MLAVVLNLVGLAGLTVMLAFVASDSGLWPSFSGDRVYTAAKLLAAEREETPAASTTEATTEWSPAAKSVEAEPARRRVETEEVMWREPVGVRPGACEARAAALQAEAEARRRQQQQPSCKRARLLSRRATSTAPTV